jgi:hypothetical protein
MPLCYIIAKARAAGAIDPPELVRDAEDEPRTMEELVMRSPPYRQERQARHPHGPKHADLHTWGHVCARLTGAYQFLLKFRYQALDDVAIAVLQNGQRFERHIDQTLTMLEYPSFPDGGNMGEDPAAARPLFGYKGTTAMVFIQDLVSGGLGGSKAIVDEFKVHYPGLTCTDIFGPYDYVIEFPVVDAPEYLSAMKFITDAISPRRIKHIGLLCEPFRRAEH